MFGRGIAGVMMLLFPAGLAAQGIGVSGSVSANTDEQPAGVEIVAEETDGTPSAAETPAATEAPPTVAPTDVPESFDAKLDYGHALYLKGNFDGALEVYNMAKEMKSNDPLVLYFIACAEIKLKHYDAAITALETMKNLSGEKLASLTAKSLFLTALTEELRRDDEKSIAAWTSYKTFMEGHTQIPGFIGTAEARIQAIETKRELYQQYEIVRQRITAAE